MEARRLKKRGGTGRGKLDGRGDISTWPRRRILTDSEEQGFQAEKQCELTAFSGIVRSALRLDGA